MRGVSDETFAGVCESVFVNVGTKIISAPDVGTNVDHDGQATLPSLLSNEFKHNNPCGALAIAFLFRRLRLAFSGITVELGQETGRLPVNNRQQEQDDRLS
jgi:hypothetical protein